MTKTSFLALLLGTTVLAACGDSANQVIAGPEPGAGTRVRFFHFGINAPGVYFYANDTKLTGISSVGFTSDAAGIASAGTESTTGITYSGVGSGGFYSSITPGSWKFNARVATTTDNGLQIGAVTQSLEAGKKYSMYLSGFYDATAKTVEAFIVEDPYSETYDYANATIRFVNASPNSAPMQLIAKNTVTAADSPISATAVAYKGAGAFVTVPAGTYDLRTVLGSGAAGPFTRTGVALVAGKVYTISARGDATIVSTTATNRPFLDNTANR